MLHSKAQASRTLWHLRFFCFHVTHYQRSLPASWAFGLAFAMETFDHGRHDSHEYPGGQEKFGLAVRMERLRGGLSASCSLERSICIAAFLAWCTYLSSKEIFDK